MEDCHDDMVSEVQRERVLQKTILLDLCDFTYSVPNLVKPNIRVRPQCGQLKPRMLKIQRFWAYILDFLYKYLDISS